MSIVELYMKELMAQQKLGYQMQQAAQQQQMLFSATQAHQQQTTAFQQQQQQQLMPSTLTPQEQMMMMMHMNNNANMVDHGKGEGILLHQHHHNSGRAQQQQQLEPKFDPFASAIAANLVQQFSAPSHHSQQQQMFPSAAAHQQQQASLLCGGFSSSSPFAMGGGGSGSGIGCCFPFSSVPFPDFCHSSSSCCSTQSPMASASIGCPPPVFNSAGSCASLDSFCSSAGLPSSPDSSSCCSLNGPFPLATSGLGRPAPPPPPSNGGNNFGISSSGAKQQQQRKTATSTFPLSAATANMMNSPPTDFSDLLRTTKVTTAQRRVDRAEKKTTGKTAAVHQQQQHLQGSPAISDICNNWSRITGANNKRRLCDVNNANNNNKAGIGTKSSISFEPANTTTKIMAKGEEPPRKRKMPTTIFVPVTALENRNMRGRTAAGQQQQQMGKTMPTTLGASSSSSMVGNNNGSCPALEKYEPPTIQRQTNEILTSAKPVARNPLAIAVARDCDGREMSDNNSDEVEEKRPAADLVKKEEMMVEQQKGETEEKAKGKGTAEQIGNEEARDAEMAFKGRQPKQMEQEEQKEERKPMLMMPPMELRLSEQLDPGTTSEKENSNNKMEKMEERRKEAERGNKCQQKKKQEGKGGEVVDLGKKEEEKEEGQEKKLAEERQLLLATGRKKCTISSFEESEQDNDGEEEGEKEEEGSELATVKSGKEQQPKTAAVNRGAEETIAIEMDKREDNDGGTVKTKTETEEEGGEEEVETKEAAKTVGCKWIKCREHFVDEDQLYDHVNTAHFDALRKLVLAEQREQEQQKKGGGGLKRRRSNNNGTAAGSSTTGIDRKERFRCRWHKCELFPRRGDAQKKLDWLLSHLVIRHAPSARPHTCLFSGCSLRFPKLNALKDHLRSAHDDQQQQRGANGRRNGGASGARSGTGEDGAGGMRGRRPISYFEFQPRVHLPVVRDCIDARTVEWIRSKLKIGQLLAAGECSPLEEEPKEDDAHSSSSSAAQKVVPLLERAKARKTAVASIYAPSCSLDQLKRRMQNVLLLGGNGQEQEEDGGRGNGKMVDKGEEEQRDGQQLANTKETDKKVDVRTDRMPVQQTISQLQGIFTKMRNKCRRGGRPSSSSRAPPTLTAAAAIAQAS